MGIIGVNDMVVFDEVAREGEGEPKISPENYAPGYGFISDYLAEIFRFLRRRNFQTHVTAHVVFGGWTGRDQDAVQKTAAGLLKLMYPHRTPEATESDELLFSIDLAVEMRRRVTDQLRVIAPREFTPTTFAFRLNGL